MINIIRRRIVQNYFYENKDGKIAWQKHETVRGELKIDDKDEAIVQI